jgi:hypothetical protein
MNPDDLDELEQPTLGGWSPRARIGRIMFMDDELTIQPTCMICGAPTTWVRLSGPMFEHQTWTLNPGDEICRIMTRCDGCFSVEDRP